MTIPILTTKLFIPTPRAKLVTRERLIQRLDNGLDGKLTLISAPAGFGKTTLASEWVNHHNRPTAWLSLDESDHDATHFLTYCIAALQTITSTLGEAILPLVQATQPPSTETIMTALLNEIASQPEHFLLVLDDYHLIDSRAVDDALTFLLDHLPPQMHMLITTREDPNLPLARLRARSQLTELRVSDLRFTPDETADFLNQVMGLNLSAQDIATLETRTEGWIAGLQLAALSVQGQGDVSEFIRAFAGDNHYIVDYLVDEVLQRQTQPIRNFLLQTSILNRLNASLCDAVTAQQESNTSLETLERGNFFVVPLDDKRQWYRYHHLFADVLYAHLLSEQPDLVSTLHRRASEWYAHQGSAAEAIHHALAAKDFDRAADLIEMAVPAMSRNRQESTLLRWLQMIPQELFHDRPVLNAHYAGILLQSGLLDGVETRLRDAERWLNPMTDTGEMVIADVVEFRRLPGLIALYRAAIALAMGHITETMTYARRVLNLVTEDNHLQRGAAASLLGLAMWSRGDLEQAYQSHADGMAHLRQAGNISDAVGGTLALADIRLTQGRLREAMRIYEHGLELAIAHGEPQMRGTADMYVGMSEINLEYNNLQIATQHLMRSEEQGEHTGFPQNRYRWRVAMARVRQTEGNFDDAIDLLREAERFYVSDFYPNVRPISALRARVWIAQGKLGQALGWVHEQGLSIEDELTYLREFEHITLARLLLARYQHEHTKDSIYQATSLLERLLQAAEAGGRMGNVIEILVLQALAHQMQGDISAALVPLERALILAEPEGYIRMFIDEGAPMMFLLEKATKKGISLSYVRQLLTAFNTTENKPLPQQNLIEPLSERELEVLRLLGTELDGPEIARQLMVSLNTMRTHTKNIYTKLGVNSRRSAVRRAEELNLL